MKYVYCTNCKWFNITEDEVPTCKYETECDICDPEDSRPYEDRPHYDAADDNVNRVRFNAYGVAILTDY